MGSYKGTSQCHSKTPFTLKDIRTFQDGHICDIILENSKKLASKTCKMFLERTKIFKKEARELKVKGGPKISF